MISSLIDRIIPFLSRIVNITVEMFFTPISPKTEILSLMSSGLPVRWK